MKQALWVLIIASGIFTGCKKSEKIIAPQDKEAVPYSIELFSNIPGDLDGGTIRANNSDEVVLKYRVKDVDGTVIDAACTIMMNAVHYPDLTFKTDMPGAYIFQASAGKVLSNTYVVKAILNPPGTPFKIILTSDKYLGAIKASGRDKINFKAFVTDVNGKELNSQYQLTLDGKPFTETSFATDKPGDYVFQASIGSLLSNEYSVTANEIADRYLKIQSYKIDNINQAGLVTASITFKNISSKDLKYATFDISCYNQAAELIREDSNGSSSISCLATGFFLAGAEDTSKFEIGHFSGVASIKAVLRSVKLGDGTILYAE